MAKYTPSPECMAVYDWLDDMAGAVGPFTEGKWDTPDRDSYTVGPGETHQGLRLANGNFVGIHHSPIGVALNDLLLEDILVDGSTLWGSNNYEICTNVEYKRVTFAGVLKEHAIYTHGVGWGVLPEEKRPEKGTPSLVIDQCRFEHIGSQILQITGPRHLINQTTVTPPGGTGFAFKAADTWGGPIHVFRCFARNCCNWGTRAAAALSFREMKNHVNVNGFVLDNREFYNQGGLLLQGSPDFQRHADVSNLVLLMGVSRKAPIQVDYWGRLRIRDSFIYESEGKPLEINKQQGPLLIENCEGNVRVRIDGVDAGPIAGRIEA